MKIALIGEFSGVHTCLKKGFETLGHETDLYSGGDGFKKIQSGKSLSLRNPHGTGRLGYYRYYLSELPSLLKYISSSYDAIQLINPHTISSVRDSLAYYRYLMSIVKNNPGYKSLVVAGCEKNTQLTLSSLPRSPCPGCLKEQGWARCHWISEKKSKIVDCAVDSFDVVIPFGVPSYAAAYSHELKSSPLLPFPVDTGLLEYAGNRLGKKIRVLHGISRPGFKGSDVIMEALSKIEDCFPDSFEIVKVEKLPFEEYRRLLPTVNVVIDQLYGDGLGMNALFSMSAGCVVLTSFDRVRVGEVNLVDAPAIQIGNTADEIFLQLSELRSWSAVDFEMAGMKARQYIESNCSPVRIASRVIDVWKNSK